MHAKLWKGNVTDIFILKTTKEFYHDGLLGIEFYFPGQRRALVMSVMNLRFLIRKRFFVQITNSQRTGEEGFIAQNFSYFSFLIEDDIGICCWLMSTMQYYLYRPCT